MSVSAENWRGKARCDMSVVPLHKQLCSTITSPADVSRQADPKRNPTTTTTRPLSNHVQKRWHSEQLDMHKTTLRKWLIHVTHTLHAHTMLFSPEPNGISKRQEFRTASGRHFSFLASIPWNCQAYHSIFVEFTAVNTELPLRQHLANATTTISLLCVREYLRLAIPCAQHRR